MSIGSPGGQFVMRFAVKSTSDTITRRLSEQIGEHRFAMWFGEASIRIDGHRLEILAETRFVADWINHNFTSDLRVVAEKELGSSADVHIAVASRTTTASHRHDLPRNGAQEAPAQRPAAPDRDRGRRPSLPGRRLDSSTTLDSFVVGPSNQLAWSAATRLAEEDNRSSVSPLFIHGGCGLGKTHLLRGICRRCIELDGDASRIRYVTGEQFTNEYITAIRDGSVDRFRRSYRHVRLLAIDDVHFLSNKTRTQAEFLHTLDAIELTGARLALASDEHPHDIERFSKGLVSRFLCGMVVEVELPDSETRRALVRSLADRRHLRLTDAAVELLATRCPGSVRELQGALNRLEAMRMLDPDRLPSYDPEQLMIPGLDDPGHGMISSTMIQRMLKAHGQERTSPVKIEKVIEAVCQRIGVTREELAGRSRHRRISLARSLIAFLAREMTTHSYPEIARALGRTNHSSVHAAANRLTRSIEMEPYVNLGESRDETERIDLVILLDELRRQIHS